MLHQNKETNTLIVGGKENDKILADSKDVSSTEQSGGTGKKSSPGADKQRPGGVPEEPVNYHITDADKLGYGGATTKARANVKAIRTTVLFNKD